MTTITFFCHTHNMEAVFGGVMWYDFCPEGTRVTCNVIRHAKDDA
jgi:hypothetical protein